MNHFEHHQEMSLISSILAFSLVTFVSQAHEDTCTESNPPQAPVKLKVISDLPYIYIEIC